jgi:prolyl-tRNA synthetase
LTYQIQNKFRNELRARSGLLRGREFVMKDAYSFSTSQAEHEVVYERVVAAYHKVYERLGLGDSTYRTYADGGIFTSRFSDEFQTLSDIGEDTIYVDEAKKVAINQEILSDETLQKLGLNKADLVEKRGVEVGNTFHLETKYTDALGVYFTDEKGEKKSIIMGCYGIGISRLVGMIAEHFADDKGLVWPENIAPAKVYLARLGNEEAVVAAADKLYDDLTRGGTLVLYDDRDVRPGEKFADADLYGIPYRVVISAKTVQADRYEIKGRTAAEPEQLTRDELMQKLSA